MKRFTRMLCLLLVFSMLLAQGQPIIAAAAENDTARIVSADMGTDSGDVSNLEGYYSNEEWAAVYPQGLFVVEYSTYEVCEGGADPENPEDVYLGIVVYRIGGNALGGGKFKVSGSVLGAYAIQALTTTLYAMKVPSTDVKAYKAIVIILIVVISSPVVKQAMSRLWAKIRDRNPRKEVTA